MNNLSISHQTFETFQKDPRFIFGSMGLRYLGLQEQGRGKPPIFLFNEPKGSTLAVSEPTRELIKARLAEHEADCKKARS